MKTDFILEILMASFSCEISNKVQLKKDYIEVELEDKSSVIISVKKCLSM